MMVVAGIHKAVSGMSSEHPLLTFYSYFRYFYNFRRFHAFCLFAIGFEAKLCVCSNFHAFRMSGWWL